MATIDLMDGHRVRSDDRQWVFEKTTGAKDKKGNLVYKIIGFYPTIEGVLKASYNYFVRQSDADGVVELMNAARELLDQYAEILNPNFEIREIK